MQGSKNLVAAWTNFSATFYGLHKIVPAKFLMTKISSEHSVAISALNTAGVKPTAIARQLGLIYETVKKHVYRKKLVAGLPPKEVRKRGYFTGRKPGIVRRYLEDYPTAL